VKAIVVALLVISFPQCVIFIVNEFCKKLYVLTLHLYQFLSF
jgi:hypothetical protein